MKTVFSLFVTSSPVLLLLKMAEAASVQESCVQLHTFSVWGGGGGISEKNLGISSFPVFCSMVVVNCVTPSLAERRQTNVHKLPDGKDEQAMQQNITQAGINSCFPLLTVDTSVYFLEQLFNSLTAAAHTKLTLSKKSSRKTLLIFTGSRDESLPFYSPLSPILLLCEIGVEK